MKFSCLYQQVIISANSIFETVPFNIRRPRRNKPFHRNTLIFGFRKERKFCTEVADENNNKREIKYEIN